MMERFEHLAARYGMPPATLCAFAVARFVQQEENSAAMARMAVMDASRRAGQQLDFSEEQLERVFAPMLAAMVKEQGALAQVNLPLDGEAPGEGA
jgi:hypothetical protein